MSVVGFDFGTQSSRIAVVRAGGVDVICNEVSDRLTPSMVSFDFKRRYAGDATKTQQVGNFKNTVVNLPRLVGRLPMESMSLEESKYETCILDEKDDLLGATVNYRGEETSFSNTELVGMFMNKLKSITTAETKTPISDVVISVPSFFGEKERQALMDAAEVAGLNCLRTVNDVTAAAVCYGMMKTDIPADKAKTIVIVDIGYAGMKAAVVAITKGGVEVKAHVFDAHLGGRDIDECLVNRFVDHFIKTRKVNIRENKKALLRLRIACERMKKVLSGIQMTRLELEAFIDGNDFPLEATRVQLEELSSPIFDRIEANLQGLLAEANIDVSSIDSVEVIGGTTRIPAIKARITNVFGKEVSTTLNADEAVSRGCALLCAMDSPLVKVREFKVTDAINYPIVLTIGDTVLGEFPKGAKTGEPAILDLDYKGLSFPFTVEAHYSHPDLLSHGTPSQLSKFTITAPKSMKLEAVRKLTMTAQFSTSGCIEVTDVNVETETSEPGTVEEGQDPSSVPPKIVTRCFPLSVKVESFRVSRSVMSKLKEAEISMTLNDKLVAEIDDSKNALEEYIYESRQKLSEHYAQVATEEEQSYISEQQNSAENWLYDCGADLDKDAYVQKLNGLKELFRPLDKRLDQIKSEAEAAAAAAAAIANAQNKVNEDGDNDAAIPLAMDEMD